VEGRVVEGGHMMRFATGGEVGRMVSAAEVDDACVLGREWNQSR